MKIYINENLIIADYLAITCDEISNVPEAVVINFNDKRATYKMKWIIVIFCKFLLLITMLLLKIVTTCYYSIKHWSKQKEISSY